MINTFENNDIIICVDNIMSTKELTIGKKYNAINVSDGWVSVINDRYIEEQFLMKRFIKDLVTNRNYLIDDILK